MSSEELAQVLTASGAALAGIGAIVVTVFNWLANRDYGQTVKEMMKPLTEAQSQSRLGLMESNQLLRSFIEHHSTTVADLAAEQRRANLLLERLDERTAKIDQML